MTPDFAQSTEPADTGRRPGVLRALVRRLSMFGVVGLGALVVDVGGFNLLRFAGGEGPLYDWPLAAKLLSASASTIVSWLGNRYWTFRHRRRPEAYREFAAFVLMCALGTLVSLACLGLTHYVLGWRSPLADNISANVVGLGLGTAFRFWAYHRFVFVHRADPAPGNAAAPALTKVR